MATESYSTPWDVTHQFVKLPKLRNELFRLMPLLSYFSFPIWLESLLQRRSFFRGPTKHIKAAQDRMPPKKNRADKQRIGRAPTGFLNDVQTSKLVKAAKTRTARQGCDTRGLRPVSLCLRQCLTATYPL
ncbi:hypothetical protein JMM61_15695 [Rhodovulum sulfidophilum]|uniref:hypothetical protein n=1 Tax=Rhodovulum sulfidophilum TaxID=35806 RepID=UPI001920A1BA|nr:hypothetical protein [Rhodovulum sulfidophilum]MBL3564056.1 hypothetical protein [Rhodovulum sulfidophilum]MBL3586815.1 hypothetical protein [Rhodovulum sulfidophilum]